MQGLVLLKVLSVMCVTDVHHAASRSGRTTLCVFWLFQYVLKHELAGVMQMCFLPALETNQPLNSLQII